MCSVRYVNFSFRKVRKIGSAWIKHSSPYVHFNSGIGVVGAWHGAPCTDLCKTAQIQQFLAAVQNSFRRD